jgi:type I restriction enzyme S subunit
VREGDILFNRTNSPDLVGKTAVFRHSEPMAYAGYLVRLRVNQEATSEFISAFLNSRYGKATLRGMCKSIIGMANINATEVQTIRIPKPPVELQRTFARLVIEMESHTRRQLSSEASMDAQFASLQHRAFRGEL